MINLKNTKQRMAQLINDNPSDVKLRNDYVSLKLDDSLVDEMYEKYLRKKD